MAKVLTTALSRRHFRHTIFYVLKFRIYQTQENVGISVKSHIFQLFLKNSIFLEQTASANILILVISTLSQGAGHMCLSEGPVEQS